MSPTDSMRDSTNGKSTGLSQAKAAPPSTTAMVNKQYVWIFWCSDVVIVAEYYMPFAGCAAEKCLRPQILTRSYVRWATRSHHFNGVSIRSTLDGSRNDTLVRKTKSEALSHPASSVSLKGSLIGDEP